MHEITKQSSGGPLEVVGEMQRLGDEVDDYHEMDHFNADIKLI